MTCSDNWSARPRVVLRHLLHRHRDASCHCAGEPALARLLLSAAVGGSRLDGRGSGVDRTGTSGPIGLANFHPPSKPNPTPGEAEACPKGTGTAADQSRSKASRKQSAKRRDRESGREAEYMQWLAELRWSWRTPRPEGRRRSVPVSDAGAVSCKQP